MNTTEGKPLEVDKVEFYLIVFLPVIVVPLLVLLVRGVRRFWSYFQATDEFGEKNISELHQKWRRGFTSLRIFMETSKFGRIWVLFHSFLLLL